MPDHRKEKSQCGQRQAHRYTASPIAVEGTSSNQALAHQLCKSIPLFGCSSYSQE
ncbi:MAG: hypothetical protein ACK5GP_06450 [bacterium]